MRSFKKDAEMEDALKNLDHLNPKVQKSVSSFCRKFLNTLPGRICSICIYGSAAVGEHIPKHSDINLMIMVDRLEMNDLQSCFKLIKKGREKRISAPLLLTEEHISTSTDTFPIEFLEMKEKHINIYGIDPFLNLVIDPKNLRLQCEQQIKGKLIRLRQAYIEVGLKKRQLIGLLTTSFTSLLPVLRNSIRLVEPDIKPPRGNEEIILRVCKDFQLENEVLLQILKIKKRALKPNKDLLHNIFKGYLRNLTELSKRIDQIKVECICVEDPEST
jgi:hypothetical protein